MMYISTIPTGPTIRYQFGSPFAFAAILRKVTWCHAKCRMRKGGLPEKPLFICGCAAYACK